ncbi:MAG: hypothetical protein COB77_05380 [Gammaproteobacteria bacterium]|nr:MAG: hypothetical protein COB77_05380 [Gammaproteobacteria bacterium]
MSKTKEQQKLQHETAIKIAIDAGVLTRCKTHADGVFTGAVALTEVYTLGNEQYSKGQLEGVFSLRREMLELLEEVIPEYRVEKCPHCVKNSN